MNKRDLTKLIYLTGSAYGGYRVVVKIHEATARVADLHLTPVTDYRIGCAIVRAIRAELSAQP